MPIGSDHIQLVKEQQEELELQDQANWVVREKQAEISLDSHLAQIITGIRRCGKSTLARMALQGKPFAYLNFDDERLAGIKTEELNKLLEALYAVYGNFEYLFLDEVQNVPQWHLFVNRLLRVRIRIILTGSNAKLLSREMATHLTGRYKAIELMPFSFHEYLRAQSISRMATDTARQKGNMLKHWQEYMQYGGFPEIVFGEEQQMYSKHLFEAIISRDILFRYNIQHLRTFREIALWTTANFAAEISYNRIKNIFGLGSENTAKNYLHYLEEAWLVITLSKFSFKKQESLRNRKLYLTDMAFAGLAGKQATKNTGRILENMVFLHLYRHRISEDYEVFYYKQEIEVDFVIFKNRKVYELIQVTESLADERTQKREVRALLKAQQKLHARKLTIITLNEPKDVHHQITALPVTEWLLRGTIISEDV